MLMLQSEVNHQGYRCLNLESPKPYPPHSPEASHTSFTSLAGSTQFVLKLGEHVYKEKRSRKSVSLSKPALLHHFRHKGLVPPQCAKNWPNFYKPPVRTDALLNRGQEEQYLTALVVNQSDSTQVRTARKELTKTDLCTLFVKTP